MSEPSSSPLRYAFDSLIEFTLLPEFFIFAPIATTLFAIPLTGLLFGLVQLRRRAGRYPETTATPRELFLSTFYGKYAIGLLLLIRLETLVQAVTLAFWLKPLTSWQMLHVTLVFFLHGIVTEFQWRIQHGKWNVFLGPLLIRPLVQVFERHSERAIQ